ncbi:hypothetical protein ACMD2_18963 [Ananas comosus]|uniref:Uncharacterized protein n=1 Tax=Ananas comosus TaxID=4615 RepID=A0A199UZ19_ANACO|nr:hypothetical protein ACMD2_18963 [Ananas comosus]
MPSQIRTRFEVSTSSLTSRRPWKMLAQELSPAPIFSLSQLKLQLT